MTTTPQLWTDVDRYFVDSLIPGDPALEAALESSAAAGLPSIQVAPNQGMLLSLLARMCNARRILEIGTLGGYSTIWLARALPPDGRLVTLEFDPKHARVAEDNLKHAGLDGIVSVRVGAALDLLPQIKSEGLGPFDLIFVDANKKNNPDYFQWALDLSASGSVILIDNVVREGGVIDETSKDADILGTRRVLEMMGKEPRVRATAIQTVGSKGYDGFALAVVI
jgi:predicted O-methyltransferase YrrM